MGRTPSISDAEWKVMTVLWAKSPMTATEVAAAVGPENEWSERTVKTLLGRLVKKGALRFKEDGKRYLYSPRISRRVMVREESRSFVDRVFGGDASPLLAQIVKDHHLSPGEIDALRRLLDEKEAD